MSQLVKKSKVIKRKQKKIKTKFTYCQTEIADCLGVDRSSIARWCREGLPHKRGMAGKEHQIELRTAIHWSIGHRAAMKKNIEISPLEKILWALATEQSASNE